MDEDDKAIRFLDAVGNTLRDRAETYPPYSQEAIKVADIWNILSPQTLTAADVAHLMMLVKIVRHSAGNSPDSLTDLVGYAARLAAME